MRRLILGLCLLPCLSAATVQYSLTPDPAAGTATVAVTLDKAAAQETFRIPAWTPGYYFIDRYQDKLFDIKATDPTGRPLVVSKLGPRAWQVRNPRRVPITLSYRVQGDDAALGFFGVSIKKDTGFVNGPAAFMFIDGRLEEPTNLRLKLPPTWKVATGMDVREDGTYVSSGYDELVDHPLQLGQFTRRTFTVKGIPFEAVFVSPDGKIASDVDAETERLRKVSQPALDMFGSAPFKRFVYIIHLQIGSFSGGLEHRASTVLAVPNTSELEIDDLAAHEFFHAWNVKQIRPSVLGPFDYTKEVRTGNLWFAEGVTDYYAKLHPFQAGLQDELWLLDQLSMEIGDLQRSKARKRFTLETASRQAWLNGGDGLEDLSYYNKGQVAGLLFDVAIRHATQGRKSLDDVLRTLYARHRLPKPGYGEDALRLAINEAAGRDLTPLYNLMVRSTEEMPYASLRRIGLRLLVPGNTYRNDKGVSIRAKEYRLERDPEANAAARSLLKGWLEGSKAVDQQDTQRTNG
jgi:predicted metalloprotease with PDZ domain